MGSAQYGLMAVGRVEYPFLALLPIPAFHILLCSTSIVSGTATHTNTKTKTSPYKKLSPAAAGRTPLFPSSTRKQNRIFLREVRRQYNWERSDLLPPDLGEHRAHPSIYRKRAWGEPHTRCCRIGTFRPSFDVSSVAFYFCGEGKTHTKHPTNTELATLEDSRSNTI